LLIDKSGNICLSDFGISLFYKEEYFQNFAGTPCWMAPEMLSEKCICNFKTDIWALGITAIELAEGKVPYSELPEEKVIIHINFWKIIKTILESHPPKLKNQEKRSLEFVEFLKDCLQKDPNLRPSAKELLGKHEKFFIQSASKEIIIKEIIDMIPPLEERVKNLLNRK
jgi:serine/threonine protein kinase